MFMKKTLGCLVMAAFMVSCADLDLLRSEIDSLSEKLQEIEQNCDRLNNDLAALTKTMEALQKEDMVTSVAPLTSPDGSVEGYIINFLKSGLVTIYHGKKGDAGGQGQPGKDAAAPVISVSKGDDGKYYWTSDGEWILDAEGWRIEVDKGGKAPEIKIEEDKWYVSYDDGQSWIYLADFTFSSDGYVFQDVDADDPDHVRITLSDGTVLELPKYKTSKIDLKSESAAVTEGALLLSYSVSNATSVSVSVDDSDVDSVVLTAADAVSGTIEVGLRADVSLLKQRLFVIFSVDGASDDWWMVSFDSSGKVIISDIR